MFKFIKINSVTRTEETGVYLCDIEVDTGNGPESAVYGYRPEDKFGVSGEIKAALTAWFDEGREVLDAPTVTPVDTPLTRLQFNALVRLLGFTFDDIAAAIQTSTPDATQQAVALARFDETRLFRRGNAAVLVLNSAFGVSETAIDETWATVLQITTEG